jgi:hypothetical protein
MSIRFVLSLCTLSAIALVSACGERVVDPIKAPTSEELTASADVTWRQVDSTSVVRFLEEYDDLMSTGRVFVALKNADAPARPRRSLDTQRLIRNPSSPGLNDAAPHGFSPFDQAQLRPLLAELRGLGAEEITAGNRMPFLIFPLPTADRLHFLRILAAHPNVDYVEVIPAAIGTTHGSPIGSNPSDDKHTYHQVLDAWDYTRGAGAKVGVLDSGLAEQLAPGSTDLGSTTRLGFSDKYTPCNSPSTGACESTDDQTHGTLMASIIGAADNAVNSVGIAPDAQVYSMKMAYNCDHVSPFDEVCLAAKLVGEQTTFIVDYGAVALAVDYAVDHDFDVLSMSWTVRWIATPWWAFDMYWDAFHVYDILLLAATGNTGGDCDGSPARHAPVMGVGALTAAHQSYGCDMHEEVSAYSGWPANYAARYRWDATTNWWAQELAGFGGYTTSTSASTATVAGIAALVRSYYPNESAQWVRTRLVNTADGFFDRVNARQAIEGVVPRVSIQGPSEIPTMALSCSWVAYTTGSDPPYSYEWKKDGIVVGNGSTYSTGGYGGGFTLSVEVTDAKSDTDTDSMVVTTSPFAEECS